MQNQSISFNPRGLLVAFISLTAFKTIAETKSVWVVAPPANGIGTAGGACILGWNFQPKTVAQIFPNPPEGTMLYFFHPDDGWTIITYDLGEWTLPNYQVQTGQGFIYLNPLNEYIWFTLTGEVVTNSTTTYVYEEGKYYLVANSYPDPLPPCDGCDPVVNDPYNGWVGNANYIECISINCYTEYSHNYVGQAGDWVRFWRPRIAEQQPPDYTVVIGGDWVDSERTTNNCPYTWYPPPPYAPDLRPGYGMWLRPSSTRTWVHKRYGQQCPW